MRMSMRAVRGFVSAPLAIPTLEGSIHHFLEFRGGSELGSPISRKFGSDPRGRCTEPLDKAYRPTSSHY